jgi:hypothetical protein
MDPDLEPDSPEAKTRSRLVKMWTDFAKTGYSNACSLNILSQAVTTDSTQNSTLVR